MALYINKVFNVCGAWEKVSNLEHQSFSELSSAFGELDEHWYLSNKNSDAKEEVGNSLREKGWTSKILLGGGPLNLQKFRGTPSSLPFFLHKDGVGVDWPVHNPSYFDSWVTYKIKVAQSLGVVPVLCLPLYDERLPRSRMTYEYAVERLQYIDIVEGNQFLILGYSPVESEAIQVEEADTVIRRTITFEPHQLQAGVSLLSYFSEVLKQKCSDSNSKVSIEQDGEKVRLMIKSEAGMEHKVEALLNEYGEVLNGTLPAEQFMADQVQLLSLQRKLDMAALEVKHQQDILALTKANYDQRIVTLEEQVSGLRQMLSESITSHRIAQEQVSKLIDKYGNESEVELELLSLAKKLDERSADVQKDELERLIKQLHAENPKMANEFLSLMKGPLEGVVGNIIYSWLPQLSLLVGSVVR
ncbi:conserved hypothetical protein [Vibrio crassostreae]|nr:conserved hypothetical protein [Vibrio crassostreae]